MKSNLIRCSPTWYTTWCACVFVFTCSVVAKADPTYKIALFNDLPPHLQADEGLSQQYQVSLEQAGLQVRSIDLEELIDPVKLNVDSFDALLLLDSPHTPAQSLANIHRFMKNGGDVVLLGGEAFAAPLPDRALVEDGKPGVVDTAEQVQVRMALDWVKPASANEFDHGTSDPTRAASTTPVTGPHEPRGVEFSVADFGEGWATWLASLPEPPPADSNLLRLWVRADALTPQLVVELRESNGARWAAVIETSSTWQLVSIPFADFKLFRDGGDKSRGGEGDRPHAESLSALSVGIADEFFVSRPGTHTFSVAEIAFAYTTAIPEKRYDNPFQEPGFVMYPFDYLAEYRLPKQARLAPRRTLPGSVVFEDLFSAAEDLSAIAVALPYQSTFVPLLGVEDEHGRIRGWGLSLLQHTAGPYRGGRWLFSGITSGEVISHPGFIDVVTQAINRFAVEDDGWIQEAVLPEHKAFPGVSDPWMRGRLRPNDRGQLIDKNGRPAFLIGCNYAGPFGRAHIYAGDRYWDAELLEAGFRSAAASGVNALRLWVNPELGDEPERIRTILDAAQASNIYLLIHFRGDGKVDLQPVDVIKVAEDHRRVIEAFAGHPMVLGYDIQNEPYVTTIGAMTFAGEPSKLIAFRPADRFAEYLDEEELDGLVNNRPPWPILPDWVGADTARQLYAAQLLWERTPNAMDPREGREPLPSTVAEELREVIDDTFRQWMQPLRKMVHEADPQGLITVGYNTDLATLPCNDVLDFLSHHTYERPKQVDDTQANLDVMNELATLWPGLPVSLGEFGYSAAYAIAGQPLGADAAAVGEMTFYLSAYADGHLGAFKWRLHDEPIPYFFDQITWGQGPVPHMRYESAMGLTRYDGSPSGEIRPLGWALKYFNDYLAGSPAPGELILRAAEYPGGVAYTYRAEDALFVGDTQYHDDGIAFTSTAPTNLMLHWDTKELTILSTADAELSLDIPALTGVLAANPMNQPVELIAGRTVVVPLQ